jgi:drug/metabolite transporter (DMT)-like permease
MKWIWLAVTVLTSAVGDLISAKGMIAHGEIEHFGPRRIVRLLRYISTHPLIVTGIIFNALASFSFLALLSVSELSFAVPASAIGYIVKTALAEWYLGEHVTVRRWIGAACVAIGVYLIAV